MTWGHFKAALLRWLRRHFEADRVVRVIVVQRVGHVEVLELPGTPTRPELDLGDRWLCDGRNYFRPHLEV